MRTIAVLAMSLAVAVGAQERPGWKLVWADEFDKGTAPDPSVWSYEHGFVRNHENQFYTKNRRENVRIENGMLVIEGRKERFKNDLLKEDDARTYWHKNNQIKPEKRAWNEAEYAEYTSGSINTNHKKYWQYGRIEVRAKIPAGTGMWPAIWMMGERKWWPACGEIDIMEHVAKEPLNIYGTMHWQDGGDKKHRSQGRRVTNPTPAASYDDFHLYGIEWDEKQIVVFYDDNKYFTYDISQADQPDGSNPFRQPHYILLNLAIGGGWGGPVIDDKAFPAKYYIDYVRVYEKIK